MTRLIDARLLHAFVPRGELPACDARGCRFRVADRDGGVVVLHETPGVPRAAAAGRGQGPLVAEAELREALRTTSRDIWERVKPYYAALHDGEEVKA